MNIIVFAPPPPAALHFFVLAVPGAFAFLAITRSLRWVSRLWAMDDAATESHCYLKPPPPMLLPLIHYPRLSPGPQPP